MTRALRILAVVAAVAAIGLSALAMWLGLSSPTEDVLEGSVWGAASLSLALMGAALAFRRPRNPIGWLLVTAGLGEAIAGAFNLYGEYRTDVGGQLPGATILGWFAGAAWPFSAAALLIFLPLCFPTGGAPTPRWRWVGWLGGVSILALVLGQLDIAIFRPDLMTEEWEVIEVAAANRPLFVISEFAFPLMMLTAPFALLALVVRFIRSRGEERQQIKLLVYAGAMTVTFVVVTNVTDMPRVLEVVGSAVALPSLGIATMVAVLRYRLYDIDRIVSRTLAYAILTLLLVGIYLAAVTTLTALTAPVTGESPIAVAAATLLAAAVFGPARRRIQAAVDKRFNRARYDAQRTLESFASTLRQEVDIDDVNDHLITTVGEVLQPAAVAVWLRPKGANI